MEKTADFTEGRILSRLLRFALPVLAALFLQAMYGAVDLMVVGQFGAPTDVSAVSTGSQIMQTVTSLITGLAMGITILVGQKIGEKRPEQAGDVIGSGICLFGVLAAVLTVLMILGAGFLAGLMHAPDEAFSQTVDYIRICSAGAVFIIAYNVLGSIFRGIGDSRMPLFTVAAACVFNIGGDLLLVAGFHMGAAGAALATVAAQAAGVLLSLAVIRRRTLPFTIGKKNLRFERRLVGKILALGTPIALQDLLVSISFLVILGHCQFHGLLSPRPALVWQKSSAPSSCWWRRPTCSLCQPLWPRIWGRGSRSGRNVPCFTGSEPPLWPG